MASLCGDQCRREHNNSADASGKGNASKWLLPRHPLAAWTSEEGLGALVRGQSVALPAASGGRSGGRVAFHPSVEQVGEVKSPPDVLSHVHHGVTQ